MALQGDRSYRESMASINKQVVIERDRGEVWAALTDIGNVHRLFPGVLKASRIQEDGRVVTFVNDMVVREIIVDRDDKFMRLVYAAVEGGVTTHHNASWQLFNAGKGRTRFVWISDFLPDEVAPTVQELVDAGTAALKRVLEG
jgi:carbon monoxide dehydrogenase subunit G